MGDRYTMCMCMRMGKCHRNASVCPMPQSMGALKLLNSVIFPIKYQVRYAAVLGGGSMGKHHAGSCRCCLPLPPTTCLLLLIPHRTSCTATA